MLSIIVPVYNILDCLERCVHSLTAQTYSDIEILLVDDGSTDGTAELCDALATQDTRIRVIHKENGGSSSARNLGIRMARGEYLGFVDSDDYVEPDMYERLYRVICEKNAFVAQIGRDEVDDKGQALPDICTPPQELTAIDSRTFLRELLLHRGDCSFCTKLINRSLFFPENATERLFPEGVLNEDFRLLVQMLPDIPVLYSLPGYGYHVYYRIGSNTRKKSREEFSRVFVDIVNNADFVYDIVREDFPELEKEAIRFNLFQRLDYLLHIPISQMTRENAMYGSVLHYLRSHSKDTLGNPYLTGKNKLYLLLFTIAPKSLRKVHRLSMRLRGIE